MGSHGIDLVYEIQGELNWDKEFASLACKEYARWLELRAKTGDFQFCKLPPSRVVAMVWNLHRQWTFDYENTCAALGGFIHHYPPAMRLSFSREQGYAVTLQTYKSHFQENPPASYWEPPICPSRSDVGPPGLLRQNIGQSENMETHLPSAAFPQRNSMREIDESRVPDTDVGIPKSGVFRRLKRKSTSNIQQAESELAGQQVVQGESNQVTPTTPTTLDDPAEPLSMAAASPNHINAIQIHEEHRTERGHGDTTGKKKTKVIKTSRDGRRVQEGFVLRPLAPGEKRKRGRPSMSDYVPVPQLTTTRGIKENSILLAEANNTEQNIPVAPSPTRSKYPSMTIGKRRKGASPKTKTHLRAKSRRLSQTADDTNPKYSGPTNQTSPTSRRRRNIAAARSSDATGRKNVEASKKRRLTASVRIGPDGKILRRPPGRPRKDGSWPVPRAVSHQPSQSTRRRKSDSGLLSTSPATKDASGKQQGYLPSALVVDADIGHRDIPISELEGHVSQQIIDTADTDSNEIGL